MRVGEEVKEVFQDNKKPPTEKEIGVLFLLENHPFPLSFVGQDSPYFLDLFVRKKFLAV
jgi:hypothetical protein